MLDGRGHQNVDQPPERRRIGHPQGLGRGVIAAAFALDHISRQRPGCPTEPDQRRLGGYECFEIVVAIFTAAGTHPAPFRIGGGFARGLALRRFGRIRKHVLDRGIERVLDRRGAGYLALGPVGLRGLAIALVAGRRTSLAGRTLAPLFGARRPGSTAVSRRIAA